MCRISGSIKRVKCLEIQLYVLRKHHVLLATDYNMLMSTTCTCTCTVASLAFKSSNKSVPSYPILSPLGLKIIFCI